MNYDENIQKAEAIVKELEQAEALSMEVYKQKAAQVKELLDQCEQQLTDMCNLESVERMSVDPRPTLDQKVTRPKGGQGHRDRN